MTMTPNMGRLEPVEPRSVWDHEAQSFTPWLLQNVDVLSDLLGMDLELNAAEHPVGDFSLDLLGRDVNDDSVVIVENQLERSDHSHLGQLLTYAAGTDPRNVVWITTAFRSEHRAALDWLNEHTDPDTRFFGVEIEVVRIGDSPYAPNFKLVAQPNDWGKQVKAGTGVGGLSERSKLYWSFWQLFLDRISTEHPTWTKAKASTADSWYDLPTGSSNIVYSTAFALKGLRVQLYFRSPDAAENLDRFNALRAMQTQFEDALGEPAVWDEKPGKKAATVYVQAPFKNITETEQWPAILDWLIDQHVRFRRAFEAVGGLSAFV
ncbi:DUF4268 domain-containing protein [Mycolicibacterium austroafricanum]|uniref:DUF4268 domain-containing protein n=1 Tax=Mycolicibacterium austroafricanum TaxID=39687 RepID=UPI000CF92787|nr:DUF4268 domain-containing protein [Mycolicibacterium austroafricanum]PQP50705.1 DUF4268 domain-containing protein [Mycolicibacterium austroafricanum]